MKHGKTFIFGVNPVLEKLKASPHDVVEILMTHGPERSALRSIEAEAKRLGLRVIYVERGLLDRLSGRERHQGVVAKIKGHTYLPFAELVQELSLSSSSASEWVLILDGLTDPRNLGALLRTAEAVGLQHVVIPKDRSVGITPTVVKASAGAAYHLKIYRVANLRGAMASLKKHGFWMVGLDAGAREGIHDRRHPQRLGIVVGSEAKGVRPLILRECDYVVSIPMLGKITSLNVAVAGAVFLYELLRQRLSVDKVGAKS
jgi:23S rRNA (guanosine2251-2'-O)-methyltransferase